MYYNQAKELMSNKTFKNTYRRKCDRVMETQGKKFNMWVDYFHKNGLPGLIDNRGRWCWKNTINTNPSCFVILYKFYISLGGEPIDFTDYGRINSNLDKFWSFLEVHWELIFTTNIDTKYHSELSFATNKSWSIGQITTIAFLYVYKNFFPNIIIKKIDFDLDRGDPNDFKGIDVIFYKNLNDKITIQIKEGKFYKTVEGYVVDGAVNDLKYTTTFYSYVNLEDNKIILLRNNKSLITRKNSSIIFDEQLYMEDLEYGNETVSKILFDILKFCVEKKIIFDLQNEKNDETTIEYVDSPEKILTINIKDFKDESLYELLEKKLKELQQLLN